jgi:hypothetical protein
MPNIDEFSNYTNEYLKKVVNISADALKKGSDSGADYMRKYIESDSPTGTRWHKRVNESRGMKDGRVDSGTMLNSVDSTAIAIGSQKLSTSFGWIKNRQEYFLDQDSGRYWHTAYGKPSGIGMGLLNTAQDGGGKGTIRVLGAYYYATNEFIDQMKKAGFAVSKDGGEVF